MTMRKIHVQLIGAVEVQTWYSDVIPRVGEQIRIDNNRFGREYRVVEVVHRLWPEPINIQSIPTVFVKQITDDYWKF